ncbi:phage portal protein, partial [Micrococcus sp. SIMBA_144]
TVERNPIAGVRYIKNEYTDEEHVYLYTDSVLNVYKLDEEQKPSLDKEKSKPHRFNGVPIIEYENSKFRLGDFEGVLTL